jgi:RNA polymerase sigma-70 factor (ECF subfamily)
VTTLDQADAADDVADDAAVFAAAVRRPELLADVFDRYAPELLRYLTRRVGPHDAEDLLGDLFVVALERRASFDGAAGSARPWLYGIASNLLRRHHRDEVRFLRALARVGEDPPTPSFDEHVDERVTSAQDLRRLATALAGLSTGDRDVLLLVAWGDLAHDEVATALAIPAGTVKSRLHRARRQLRAHLDAKDVRR